MPLKLSSKCSSSAAVGSSLEQLLFVVVEHVVAADHERAASQVLDATVVGVVTQLLGHPLLRLGQRHSLRYLEDQPDALVAGRYVSQRDAEFHFAACHLIEVVGARVFRQVVDVVDGESAGHSRLVVAVAVAEGGVEADHGQVVSLQLGLELFEGLTRERTFFYLREVAGNLVAGVTHALAIHCSVEELRRTGLHLSGTLDRV